MAKQDDKSKAPPSRSATGQDPAALATAPHPPGSPDTPRPARPPAQSLLEQTIEAERTQLLQAAAVLKCLYEVLLYSDDDEGVSHAEAAHVAARLVEESVERLDAVKLKPLIEALKGNGDLRVAETLAVKTGGGFCVRDSATSRLN